MTVDDRRGDIALEHNVHVPLLDASDCGPGNVFVSVSMKNVARVDVNAALCDGLLNAGRVSHKENPIQDAVVLARFHQAQVFDARSTGNNHSGGRRLSCNLNQRLHRGESLIRQSSMFG